LDIESESLYMMLTINKTSHDAWSGGFATASKSYNNMLSSKLTIRE